MTFIDVDSPDSPASPIFNGGTVALGFFDGCHLGHQAILELCREQGGDQAAVFTFPEHPTTAIPGREAPKLVTNWPERATLLSQMGLHVCSKTFDREFSSWSAERFVSDMLVARLGVRRLVVGHDYRFGHRAAGDVELLKQLGVEYQYTTTIVQPVLHQMTESFVISSTRIRQAVAEGDLRLAHSLMARPFSVTGVVQSGQQRGRTIGFPTANLPYPDDKVQPPFGVLAVRVETQANTRHWGIANFGLRPTVNSDSQVPRLEVHLFDFEGDLYGQSLKVELRAFVRPEQKFSGMQELQAQIQADVTRVRSFFSSFGEVGSNLSD